MAIEVVADDLPSLTREQVSPGHKRSWWTVGRKIIASVALPIVIGTAIIIGMATENQVTSAVNVASGYQQKSSEMLAAQISVAVRFKQAGALSKAHEALSSNEDTSLTALRIYDKTGSILNEYIAPRHEQFKFDALPGLDAALAAASGMTAPTNHDELLVVTPITVGADAQRVGTLVVVWNRDSIREDALRSALHASITGAIILSVVLGLLVYLLNWVVSKPLVGLQSAMTALAKGDLQVAIPYRERRDEIAEMAHSLEVFRGTALRDVEAGRLLDIERQEAAAARRKAMIAVADNFERSVREVVDSLSASTSSIKQVAGDMRVTADQTNSESKTAVEASVKTDACVQTVAAATEQLAASSQEIGRQVSRSTDIVRAAMSDAEHTDEMVQGLANAADRIGEVVRVISGIARQTNLLALNATIEAARAGDAGKGFSVVANEVKSLANQTSRATDDIAKQVNAIQSATSGVVKAIRDIVRTIDTISEVSSSIASAVEQQDAATNEIARNVQEVSNCTGQVSTSITEVLHAAVQTGLQANQFELSTAELDRQASHMRERVNGFISRIRADN